MKTIGDTRLKLSLCVLVIIVVGVLKWPVNAISQPVVFSQEITQEESGGLTYKYYPVRRTNMNTTIITRNGDTVEAETRSVWQACVSNYETMVNVQFQRKYAGSYAEGIGEAVNVECTNNISSISIQVWFQYYMNSGSTRVVYLDMKKSGCDFALNYTPKKIVNYKGNLKGVSRAPGKNGNQYSIELEGDFWQ
jgi:hypothetical protein